MRTSHDFLGCSNRLRAEASRLEEHHEAVREQWRDARAEEFSMHQIQPVLDILKRLSVVLQEAGELASQCQRRLRDPDYE